MTRKTTPKRNARKPAPRKDSSPPRIRKPAMPRTAAGLQRAVHALLGVKIPDRSICPNHASPMAYLEASFLHQQDLLVWANRGGGKTMLAAAATLLDALYRAPVKIRVLGGSFDQSDRLAEYIREFCRRRPELIDGPIRKDRISVVGGSEIRTLAQSQRAVRGQHVQKIRCDEVDLFDSEVWQAVQFATRSEQATRGSIEVLSTLHRRGGLMDQLVQDARGLGEQLGAYKLVSWCLWEVIERCGEERQCQSCPLQEDCRGVARQADGFFRIDDAITIKARSSRAAWEAEMLCRGPQRQWLVFNEFQAGRHVREVEYVADWPCYRAIDFGYAAPLVCLWIQLTPAGAVHVIDEYVQSQRPLNQHAAEILKRDHGPVVMTYVDPAGRQRESTSGAACTEMLAAAGIPCNWRGSTIIEGIELIRSALAPAAGGPKLYVHPRCKVLIEAFESYHYPPPDTTGDPDRPVKDGPDHPLDALRYFFVNRVRPGGSTTGRRY